MVERKCSECGEKFHPYDETDILCNDCYPKKFQCWCKGCGKWFESWSEDDCFCEICELKLEEEFGNDTKNSG